MVSTTKVAAGTHIREYSNMQLSLLSDRNMRPRLLTEVEVYKALLEMMLTLPDQPIYLCHLLADLERTHNIDRDVLSAVRIKIDIVVEASSGIMSIRLPAPVDFWLQRTGNVGTDIDNACRSCQRIGVLTQLIANEEAKNAPSNG
jgi:hypothetical protein